ncbi:MAG: PQQ-binding-like beta-propeller repeat protein [Bacteroidota bacterium]
MVKQKKQRVSEVSTGQKRIRLWPGVVIVILQWLLWFGIPLIIESDIGLLTGMLGVLVGVLGIIVWWTFFSRAPGIERWGAILLMIVAMIATNFFLDESLAASQMGMTFVIYSLPFLCLAFVIWAVVTQHLSNSVRRISMVATIVVVCGVWTLLRSDGMTSDIGHDFSWRWAGTPEEQFLTQTGDEPMAVPMTPADTGMTAEWPGFRGPERNGIIHGVQIATDWTAFPPVELWRRPVGPGFSSFAVNGNLLFTQEQRGEEEVVSCYNLLTGQPVWKHSDAARFLGDDANPGPRATPTLTDSLVCTLGATGILNVFDSRDGSVIWSHNAVADINARIPGWGLASSPLVVDDVVVVHVDSTLVAYDRTTGDLRWTGPAGTGYSSAQLVTIDSLTQILMFGGNGLTSFAPADGTILWEYKWSLGDCILQPGLAPDNEILLSAVLKELRLIKVTHNLEDWTIEESWTSNRMRSNFNDLVVHKGHAYGFENQNLACLDLKDGSRKWKGKRYGGQILLLADQDLMIVLTEKGDVVLVNATPDQFTELARCSAINGKTWNHPVLVDDILVVRNREEMAAFRLSPAGS